MKDLLTHLSAALVVVSIGILFGCGFSIGFAYTFKDHVIAIAPIERKAQ